MLIGAFALGQAGPYMEKLVTAAGAATTIFNTIDRVSVWEGGVGVLCAVNNVSSCYYCILSDYVF